MRVVYYPFNTHTRLALDSSSSSNSSSNANSLFPRATGRSGGSTLCVEEQSLSRVEGWRAFLSFFCQTLNSKQRKISQTATVICNKTHTETRLNAFHTHAREEKYAHFSLEKDGRILSAFVFLWCITHTRYKLCFFSARV